MIKAMKLLPDNIKCIFVGIGEVLEETKKYVKENNLADRIKFLGYRSDIGDILNSVDLNILSTNYEGLPLIILETLATGTLMLGSRVEGVDEILKYNEFLFEKGNEKELVKKIEKLLYDKELIITSMEKTGEIIKEYSLEEMIKKYIEIKGNEKELVKKIEKLLYDKELIITSMEKTGEIIKEYSLEEMIKKYIEIYKELKNEYL